MKVKIITEVDEQTLEKEVNKFLKKEKIKPIHIETKEVTRKKTVNQVKAYQKEEIYEHDFMATIIYEG